MTKYIMRLDDASDYMDIKKWERMEHILDQYGVKPIFGIIPDNKDESLISVYEKDESFWEKMHCWIEKDWIPALHGYEHRYVTEYGGINPVNARSEFAGLPLEEQSNKIKAGYNILKEHGIEPEIFFAPSHTFDENTLIALKNNTPIRVISDTIAADVYKKDGFWFIPQQSGQVRKMPLKLVTFCYHPNVMKDSDFVVLENFLRENSSKFAKYSQSLLKSCDLKLTDKILRWIYFSRRK